jgi:hypothetical protein
MRNRSLHDALRAFADHASLQLAADAAEGAEVPFEVLESGGGPSPLYCYRPLTGEFIAERQTSLARLPTYVPACRALEGVGGLERYLELRSSRRIPDDASIRAEAALRCFLGAVWDGSPEFELTPERFDRAYRELESSVFEARAMTTVVAPLLGLEFDSREVALAEGFAVVRGDALDDPPPDALRPLGGARPPAFVSVTVDDVDAVAGAIARLRGLLTALRLVDASAFALGAAAWARLDAGAWRVVPLSGTGGSPRGAVYRVAADEEDELRGFVNLIARRLETSVHGELGWALRRFELGCERTEPLEALTDHLLALRALLEPEGPTSGRLAQRLSAICALPDERQALAERAAHAIALERALTAGLPPSDPVTAVELAGDMARHLRALLRDVLCGHLDADLVGVADSLLGEGATDEQPVVA